MLNNEHHIKSVRMIDFLSYEDQTIELAPLTVIIGENLQGKSNLRRALAFVMLNDGRVSDDPEYDNIRRILPDGTLAKTAQVIVTFNDGLVVERVRGIGNNKYHITLQSGEKITIGGKGTSVGRNVPEEIENLTGFRQIIWPDKTKTAIQFQNDDVDGKFLLADKNVAIDTKLGFIIGADIIESAVKQATTEGISTSRERTKVVKELAEIQERLDKFDGVEALEKRVGKLDKLLSKYEAANSISSQGTLFADKIVALRHRVKLMETLDDNVKRVDTLIAKCKQYSSDVQTYHKVCDVWNVHTKYTKLPIKKLIDSVDKQVEVLYSRGCEVRDTYDRIDKVNKLEASLKSYRYMYTNTVEQIEQCEVLQSELIKQVPVCPLSGNIEEQCILFSEEL